MKKLIALLLALIFVLSLCACGNTSAGSADNTTPIGTTDNNATEGADASEDAGATEPTEGNIYVGTWKVIPPDSNSFPPLYLVLNADGTAGWGAKLDNLSPRIWYESDDEDAVEGQMELSREDNKGYGDDFYITEDGTLYMEVNLTVGENSYDHVYFEKQ